MTKDQLKQLEADLWSAADNLRANSDLKSSEYSTPVLGLIFLKFADNNYRRHEAEIIAEYQNLKGTRREKKLSDIAIEKCGFCATIGAIGINLTPACTNQGFITCIPNSRYPLPFLYHWLKLSKPHFELLAGGATLAELTKGTFKGIEILTPPEPLAARFNEFESPIFKAIETHLRENEKLAEIRDLLLPRLISGKLSVENLDIQFPPSMVEEAEAVA